MVDSEDMLWVVKMRCGGILVCVEDGVCVCVCPATFGYIVLVGRGGVSKKPFE